MRQVRLTAEKDRRLARSSARSLKRFFETHPEGSDEPFLVRASGDGEHKTVAVPSELARVLLEALDELGEGRALALDFLDAQLSTQEAADLLQVSRPYLVQNLLETGKIPFHKVGNRRRIELADVMRYKRRRQDRKSALRELTEEAQELEMGYE